VISITPGLTAAQHSRALANGPDFIESEQDYPALLAATGWTIIDRADMTDAYGDACARQIEADVAHGEDLAALIGRRDAEDRLANWRSKLSAIGDGLFRRELFVAAPAG